MKLFKLVLMMGSLLTSAIMQAAGVETKIIDAGQGLASITRMPDGSYVVYDTGDWNNIPLITNEITNFMGDDKEIALMILSHSDSDHIAATDKILDKFTVKQLIRTGHKKEPNTPKTWIRVNKKIEAMSGKVNVINLAEHKDLYREKFEFGDATLSILSGYDKPPESWGISSKRSEYRNANSIVVRVEYEGRSILFTGDAVGRDERLPNATSISLPAIATERYLINNKSTRPIMSDVLIAAHHGGNDGSSYEFIREVSPSWVIFSAGSGHNHPRRETAARFIDSGLAPECLLRTDLGDSEDDLEEWDFGRDSSRKEKVGDDSIMIILHQSGSVTVQYEGRDPVECQSAQAKPAMKAESDPEECSGSLSQCRKLIKQQTFDRKFNSKSYNEARKSMYGSIDSVDGVTCGVYSGYCQKSKSVTYLNPINAEHTIPQSWFSKKQPMRSDVHHLFPTHGTVNNHRGSLPFGEIKDTNTTKWYKTSHLNSLAIETQMPDAREIDGYSELHKNTAFEPVEHHKGNVARAAAYFYTMYPTQAGSIQKLFVGGVETMVKWHYLDPVDPNEQERNNRIETVQGNRNPFIDNPELLCKSWAPHMCSGNEIALSNFLDITDENTAHLKAEKTDSEAPICDMSLAKTSGYDHIQKKDKYNKTNTTKTDYFGLVYSWSPGYCSRLSNAKRERSLQCHPDADFKWVVHGLWAQNAEAKNVKDHPRWCKGDLKPLSFDDIKPYLCMSPGSYLLQGEWEKHGACDFNTGTEYFEATKKLHTQIKLPAFNVSIKNTIGWIKQRNPHLSDKRLRKMGSELMICYNTNLEPINCP